jgi:hypothetical protein
MLPRHAANLPNLYPDESHTFNEALALSSES